jgi:hypothetical protein
MGGAIRLRKKPLGAFVALLVVAAMFGVVVTRIGSSIRDAEQGLSLPVLRTCAELMPAVKGILIERYTAIVGHGPELETMDMDPVTGRTVTVTPWTGGEDPGTEGCRWSADLTPQPDGKCSILMTEVRRYRGRKIGSEEKGPPGWRVVGRDHRDKSMHWALMAEVMPDALPWAARWWHPAEPGSCPRLESTPPSPLAPPVSN